MGKVGKRNAKLNAWPPFVCTVLCTHREPDDLQRQTLLSQPLNLINQKKETHGEKNLSELLAEWLATGDYTAKSLSVYSCTARMIERAGLTLEDFNESTVCQEKFAAATFKPEWKRRTIASHLLRFCSFANWLAHQRYTAARHRPLRKLKRRPNVRELPTDEEVRALVAVLRAKYEQPTVAASRQRCWGKNYLATVILIETGARVGEVINLERRDLISHRDGAHTHHAIMFRGTKTDAAERAVMIPTWLYEELKDYATRFCLRERLFISQTGKPVPERTFGTWLSRFCEQLELSCHITPHTFRFRKILQWMKEKKGLEEIMLRIGHSDAQMVLYYFNQVRRLMPWLELSEDAAVLKGRRAHWRRQRRKE